MKWPGSVVHNLETYVKALCFYFFVVATVNTERKLRVLLAIYVATQVWRVLEPLYLHIRSGYWGSFPPRLVPGSTWTVSRARGMTSSIRMVLRS